jgi:hypothetical protein
LEQLDHCFKTWKISDCFNEVWINDPSSVPDHVGAVIAKDIMRMEMSGPQGDPKRNLEAMIHCYNSGKINATQRNAFCFVFYHYCFRFSFSFHSQLLKSF